MTPRSGAAFCTPQDKATAQTSRKDDDDATAKTSAHPFLFIQMQTRNCVLLLIYVNPFVRMMIIRRNMTDDDD